MVAPSEMIVFFRENDNWTTIHIEENVITDTDSMIPSFHRHFEYCDKFRFANGIKKIKLLINNQHCYHTQPD